MKTIEQIFRHHFIAFIAKHENVTFEEAERLFEDNVLRIADVANLKYKCSIKNKR